ncbi:MAG: class A beta-lactamase-related serine hydrolase [Rhodobacteraceae bacterium]|nr:MAG: class A beta-lactamase-related serine hydrolase [Paracoccaceae bacterium]
MSRIAAALEASTAAGNAPGVVGLVARGAGVVYEGAFGVRSVETGAAMTVNSVFRIYSMTKAIGAVAAAKLIEAGSLDPDAPVASILPEFGEVPVLAGFDGDVPRLRTPRTPATVRHLASHTSGLAYESWNADVARWQATTGARTVLTGTKAALLRYPMVCDPGTRWVYGVGVDWLGLVVEKVSGRRIDAFVRDALFQPLGMVDTAFEPDALADRLVAAHYVTRDGFGVLDMGPPARPEVYGMGHCLYSTAHDYMRFLRMLLNRGELDGVRVLKPATVDFLTANAIGDLTMGRMVSVAPRVSADVDLLPGTPMKHAFGFATTMADTPGKRAAGSQGWAGIANTHYWFDPARDVAGVLMMQFLPFVDPRAMAVYDAFERAVYAEIGG